MNTGAQFTAPDENGIMLIGGMPTFELREADPSCKHGEFEVIANISRLSHDEDAEVTGYSASIDVRCKECRGSFRFVGLPNGSNPHEPTCGMYGIEGRFPIRPFSGPEESDGDSFRYVMPRREGSS